MNIDANERVQLLGEPMALATSERGATISTRVRLTEWQYKSVCSDKGLSGLRCSFIEPTLLERILRLFA